ncbi:uncharacterized protein LOC142347910 [Convolutriloba macropyga]|uniref:uncharacterized protein LOC142347910 n=1 Tax=Convolutriloba macropyga TaxID=536237 RepID=UPI003F528C4C
MKALIADHVNKKLSLEERDQIPSIDEQDDVIVRIVCAGVCGTDISTLHGKYPGKHGIINGHEAIGDVIKIGGDVTTLQAGDRVVLQPNSFCEDCDDCDKYKSINSTHCQNWSTFGIHSDGAMAEYAKFKAKYLRKLPDGFRSMNAVLLEPIACVYHGVNKLQSLPRGHEVLIMGAGMAGLLWIRILSHKG